LAARLIDRPRRAAQSAVESQPIDIWQALADRLDLGAWVPTPTPGVEVARLTSRNGQVYYVLRSPAPRYLRLDAADYQLWLRMDGHKTVREIAVAYFQERGGFVADRLARLVGELRAGGFLGPIPVDALAAADRHRSDRAWTTRASRLIGRALCLEVATFRQADALFGAAYRTVGRLLYARPAKILWSILIVVGLVVWWRQLLGAEHALFKTNGSYTLGLLTLGVLDIVGVALHEIAQGLTVKRHGRRVNGAGVLLLYSLPVAYVESSDIWMAGRRERMSVSLSGPFAMLVLGSVLALLAAPLDGTEMGAFLFKGASIWIANAIFNLLPILDLDGYFILVDYFEMPALRANALAFVRGDLLGKLRARARFARDELVFTAFGLAYGLLIALIPLLILEARDLRYADSLSELWARGDWVSQAMAVSMTAMFLGPAALTLVPTLIGPVIGGARLGLDRWRRFRGRVPPEVVAALAALPFLRDVPRGELVAIAAHLRREEAGPGQVIVRQGAPGDRFYLLQAGTVAVTKLTSDEQVVPLARLSPGDHFGEAALVAHVARTATVTAETPVRLLSLDGGHFRRWLEDRVEIADAIRRSMAERDRLARHPVFAGLGPAELDRLAVSMLVTRYSAGDVIVRQGEPGDRFFLLVDGRVGVVREEGGVATVLAALAAGDFFGELALLDDVPRGATVRALTPVEAYTLDRTQFRSLLGRLPTGDIIRRTARLRTPGGRPLGAPTPGPPASAGTS
ncbi:MAG: cyclic nucleotide-binding domain-containing protein, partial [Chloroflexota bacterium]|nr:cyclic nucleotide-binding domain-containing protein [Chloroflexota bacterium]